MSRHAKFTHAGMRRIARAGVALVIAVGAVAGGSSAASATSFDLLSLVRAGASGAMVGLSSGTYSLRDFSSQNHGVTLGDVGLEGVGVGRTVVTMAPYSSTKRSVIPTKSYSTNPLYLVYTSGGTPGIENLSIRGSVQGHMYGGLFVGQATNAHVTNVTISNIPGSANYPPGETFSLNDSRTVGSVYSHLVIDGGGTSAVDFASNSSSDLTVSSSTFIGTKYSHGMALWQTRNVTLNDITLKNNQSGANFERTSGAVTINRPVLANNGRYDFQLMTDQAGATVRIVDPVLATGQRIRLHVPTTYNGRANGQKRSSIHVYVHGVDRTSSLVEYL